MIPLEDFTDEDGDDDDDVCDEDEDEDEDDDDEDDEDDEDASTTLKVVIQRKFFGKFSETQELNFSDENHISPTRITFRKKHWKYSEIKVDENYNREE